MKLKDLSKIRRVLEFKEERPKKIFCTPLYLLLLALLAYYYTKQNIDKFGSSIELRQHLVNELSVGQSKAKYLKTMLNLHGLSNKRFNFFLTSVNYFKSLLLEVESTIALHIIIESDFSGGSPENRPLRCNANATKISDWLIWVTREGLRPSGRIGSTIRIQGYVLKYRVHLIVWRIEDFLVKEVRHTCLADLKFAIVSGKDREFLREYQEGHQEILMAVGQRIDHWAKGKQSFSKRTKGGRTVAPAAKPENVQADVAVISPWRSDNQQGAVRNGESPLILARRNDLGSARASRFGRDGSSDLVGHCNLESIVYEIYKNGRYERPFFILLCHFGLLNKEVNRIRDRSRSNAFHFRIHTVILADSRVPRGILLAIQVAMLLTARDPMHRSHKAWNTEASTASTDPMSELPCPLRRDIKWKIGSSLKNIWKILPSFLEILGYIVNLLTLCFSKHKNNEKVSKHGTKYLCHDSSLEKKITERIWGKNLPANSRTSNHFHLKQSSSKKAKSTDFSAIWDHLESRRILGIPASVKQDKRHEVSAPLFCRSASKIRLAKMNQIYSITCNEKRVEKRGLDWLRLVGEFNYLERKLYRKILAVSGGTGRSQIKVKERVLWNVSINMCFNFSNFTKLSSPSERCNNRKVPSKSSEHPLNAFETRESPFLSLEKRNQKATHGCCLLLLQGEMLLGKEIGLCIDRGFVQDQLTGSQIPKW
ncbi:hypothetical protein WN51_06517 [Melipona quadrifasciata]|uniref:Uncharacterized protein n=1 Tax=Melipona quadrifasciata TaxID=166423 RepID=A0A0N0BCJ3_9HYME|nr:hypothetical protein WN51_06517 [Melipona quadrifasciata]